MKVLSTVLVSFVCVIFFWSIDQQKRLDEFALGKETKVKFSYESDVVRHCEGITAEVNCITTEQLIFYKPDVLLLGNSQLHAVNQPFLGDSVVGDYISYSDTKKQKFLIISLPNANFCELTHQAQLILKRNRDLLVLISAVYDDTRSSDIRNSLFDKKPTGRNAILLRERSERFLLTFLQKYLNFEQVLSDMKARLLVSLYMARNTIFRINASTIRPKNNRAYLENFNCLERLIAEHQDVRIKLYIAPIRNDVKLPYNLDDYAKFKVDIKELEEKYGNTTYYNFEKLVPDHLWGAKDSTNLTGQPELDFMHFQTLGHQILAKVIKKIVNEK